MLVLQIFTTFWSFFLQEIRRRGLKVAVAGIPKTIDNDIPVLLIVSDYDYYISNYISYGFTPQIPFLLVTGY